MKRRTVEDFKRDVEVRRKELRMRARLAWNNWPDNEASRSVIAEQEARDDISAASWDRVINALLIGLGGLA